jgi:dienelactone hydrolase
MPGASLRAAFIPSAGCRLQGGLYLASGEAPRPAALLLHGLPGHEKNLDLAADLRLCGLHCLYFHYRGSWGSQGDFSCAHLVSDAEAAWDWLKEQPEVDATRIALVGFSLGGWAALTLATRLVPAACVAVAPLLDPALRPLPPELAEESAATLSGTTPARLTDEWASLAPVTGLLPTLPCPVLIVTAGRDELFPPDHYDSLRSASPAVRWRQFSAGHSSDVRPGLRSCRHELAAGDSAPFRSRVIEPSRLY